MTSVPCINAGGVPLVYGGIPIVSSAVVAPSGTLQADPAPWYGSYLIGGTQADYANAGSQTWMSRNVLNIVSAYPGLEQTMGTTFATICQNVWTQGQSAGVNARMVPYFAQMQVYTTTPFAGWYDWSNTNNDYLRAGTADPSGTYPTAPIVTYATGPNLNAINTCEGGPTDGNGRNVNTFNAFYRWSIFTQGNGTTFGDPYNFAANDWWCGEYSDNQFWRPRIDGTWTWGANVTNLTGVATALQQGNADLRAAQLANWTTANVPNGQRPIMTGNVDIGSYVGNGTTTTSSIYAWAGLYDVALYEEAIGPSTTEASNGFQGLINGILAQRLTVNSTGRVYLQTFGGHGGYGWSSGTSQSSWVAQDWQGLRYSECIAFIMDCMLGIAPSTGYPAQTNFISDTQNNGGTASYTWMGKRTSATPATYASGPTSGWNGLWVATFQNAIVILNPTASAITVTVGASGNIPSGAYAFMSYNGASDASVNTGATITANFSVPAYDGRILAAV